MQLMLLICAFVFAYGKSRFAHETAQIMNIDYEQERIKGSKKQNYSKCIWDEKCYTHNFTVIKKNLKVTYPSTRAGTLVKIHSTPL